MKTLTLSALMATALFTATSASANTGTIKFSGTITSSTCDIQVEVDGVVSPTGVAELGNFKVTDATAIGTFGTPVAISLVPDLATCDTPPGGVNAQLSVVSARVDSANTDVITSTDTDTTNVGVQFVLASDTSVVNAGNVNLTSGSTDLDGTTAAVNFVAQPYAVVDTIASGLIGGTASYTISYL